MENIVDKISMDCVSLTDVGVKRDHNEDYIFVDESLSLYIVCDGMGGHAAGEVASKETAEAIAKYIKKNRSVINQYSENIESAVAKKFIKKIVLDSIIYANNKVYKMGKEDPNKKGMGTTLVMSLMVGPFAFIAHVGDSRGYLLRKDDLNQLTEDHSFVNDMVREGILTKEQAANHPQANIITRSIGIQRTVVADFLSVELMPGDRVLLCSDGLYEYFRENEITKLMGAKNLKSASDKMIEVANNRGGKDNISVVLIGVKDSCDAPSHPDQVTPDKKVKILQKIPLFQKMDYREINLILEHSSTINIPENMNIINQDEEGDDMYVLLKGEVSVIADEREITTLKAGKYFGEMSLVDKAPRSATIKSLKECKLLVFNRVELFKLLRKEPLIGMKVFWAFLQNMNIRLRENDKIIREIMQTETDDQCQKTNEVDSPWSDEVMVEESEVDESQPHRLVF